MHALEIAGAWTALLLLLWTLCHAAAQQPEPHKHVYDSANFPDAEESAHVPGYLTLWCSCGRGMIVRTK